MSITRWELMMFTNRGGRLDAKLSPMNTGDWVQHDDWVILADLAAELVDELEVRIRVQYGCVADDSDLHPDGRRRSLKHRFERDMRVVEDIRKLIDG